jgi:hypothetical protein
MQRTPPIAAGTVFITGARGGGGAPATPSKHEQTAPMALQLKSLRKAK